MVEGHRAALMDLPPSTVSNMNERGSRYYAQAIFRPRLSKRQPVQTFLDAIYLTAASVKMSLW